MDNQEQSLYQQFKDLPKQPLSLAFTEACQKGELDKVNYLLLSPELKENVDIHFTNDWGFQLACAHGSLEVVKFLLTSPDLKERPNIHADNGDAFKWACHNGHLNIINYLIKLPEFKEYVDVHYSDIGFKWAYNNGFSDMVKYFIFDLDIKKTEKIQELVRYDQVVENMFKIRDLNQQLKKDLPCGKQQTPKVKV